MKNKEIAQEHNKLLKEVAKKHHFKKRMECLYKTEGDYYITSLCSVNEIDCFYYRIELKHYDYDAIFWRILQMESNLREPDSLRSVGAFASPFVWLEDKWISYTENIQEDYDKYLTHVEECVNEFIKNNNIDEYVISDKVPSYECALKAVAYIHMGKEEEARKFAEDCIKKGEDGDYYNKGKWFFEWLLIMTEKPGTLWNEEVKKECLAMSKEKKKKVKETKASLIENKEEKSEELSIVKNDDNSLFSKLKNIFNKK